MGVCTAFVFAALVEFTFVNYMWRKQSLPEATKKVIDKRPSPDKRHQQHTRIKTKDTSNSFFPCIDRQDSSIELDMVIIALVFISCTTNTLSIIVQILGTIYVMSCFKYLGVFFLNCLEIINIMTKVFYVCV